MSKIVGSGMLDFKEQNPNLLVSPILQDVYRRNPAEKASKIIWACYYYAVLTDSDINPYSNMNEATRVEAIQREYCSAFDKNIHKEVIDEIKRISMSKEEYLLNIQISKLEQVTKSLEDQQVTTAEEIKNYLSASKEIGKLWELYDKLSKKYLESDSSKTQIHGNTELSVSEERRKGR